MTERLSLSSSTGRLGRDLMAGHVLRSSGSQWLQGTVRAEPYCILNVQVETQGLRDVEMLHENTGTQPSCQESDLNPEPPWVSAPHQGNLVGLVQGPPPPKPESTADPPGLRTAFLHDVGDVFFECFQEH